MNFLKDLVAPIFVQFITSSFFTGLLLQFFKKQIKLPMSYTTVFIYIFLLCTLNSLIYFYLFPRSHVSVIKKPKHLTIFKFGVYWDKNGNPYCTECYFHIFPKDNSDFIKTGFQRYNQFFCNKCNKFIAPYSDVDSMPIAAKSAINGIKYELKITDECHG